MIKKYLNLHTVSAFLLGALIFSISPIKAAVEEYRVKNNSYPIIVNGKETQVEALNINDFTYVKLRDVGNALGGLVNVKFNEVSEQIEIDSTINTITPNVSLPTNDENIDNITTFEKDGLTIYVKDNVEYISIKDIMSVDNLQGIFWDSDNKKLTYKNLVIPIVVIDSNTCTSYDFYINILKPLTKQ